MSPECKAPGSSLCRQRVSSRMVEGVHRGTSGRWFRRPRTTLKARCTLCVPPVTPGLFPPSIPHPTFHFQGRREAGCLSCVCSAQSAVQSAMRCTLCHGFDVELGRLRLIHAEKLRTCEESQLRVRLPEHSRLRSLESDAWLALESARADLKRHKRNDHRTG